MHGGGEARLGGVTQAIHQVAGVWEGRGTSWHLGEGGALGTAVLGHRVQAPAPPAALSASHGGESTVAARDLPQHSLLVTGPPGRELSWAGADSLGPRLRPSSSSVPADPPTQV